MCFQQMALMLRALWRNLSSFLRLLSLNTSAALIPTKGNATNTVISCSHPASSSPGQELLALWIASGLVVRCHSGISNETRSYMVVPMTKCSLFFCFAPFQLQPVIMASTTTYPLLRKLIIKVQCPPSRQRSLDSAL